MTDSLISDLPAGYSRGDLGEWKTLPWPEDADDKANLMANSLGPTVIDWAEWRTDEPGLLNDEGEKWRFTDGQARFIILWYAFDSTGRYIYRSGLKRGAKGTGKDPFGAAMCNIEFLGPSQLDFDMKRGGWYGKRHHMPLVQIASNSADQSKKLLRVANSQLGSEAVAYYDLDKGMTATYVKNSPARMEIITSSESSAEGDPATFIVLNESHHMTPNSGRDEIAAVVRRNVGKSKGNIQARVIELTNAHMKGNGSVAEESYIAWQKQQSDDRFIKDILYDSVEADPRLDFYDADEREKAIRQAYSDAPWADIPRLCSEIIDPRLSAAEAIRFYLNGLADAEDAFVGASEFMALADPSKGLRPDDRISLFLDCSKSEDATALMACRIDDGFNATVGVWQRPRGKRGEGYLVPREAVDEAVRRCFEDYRVVWFGVDPSPAKDDSTEASYWQPLIDQWHRDFNRRLRVWATPGYSSVLFDMRLSARGGAERNRLFSAETEIIRDAIDIDGLEGSFRHDGHSMLIAHTNNARARLNKFGLIIGKVTRDSAANVDATVAMIGANVGRRLALNSGRVRIRKDSRRARKGGRVMVMH